MEKRMIHPRHEILFSSMGTYIITSRSNNFFFCFYRVQLFFYVWN